MKIKVAYYISDGGDGSVNLQFYKTEAEAQNEADQDMESGFAVLDESVGTTIIDTNDFEEIE